MHENIEKKDFCLYPLKLKALDSALGLPAAKREGSGRNYRQPVIYNPRSYFMRSFTLHGYTARIIAFSLSAFRDNTCVE